MTGIGWMTSIINTMKTDGFSLEKLKAALIYESSFIFYLFYVAGIPLNFDIIDSKNI